MAVKIDSKMHGMLGTCRLVMCFPLAQTKPKQKEFGG